MLKIAALKNRFSNVYVIGTRNFDDDTRCFDDMLPM